MRVLVVTPHYPWEHDSVSGAFYKTQVDALVQLGTKVEVIAPVPWVPLGFGALDPRWRRYARMPLVHISDGVTVHRPRWLTHPRNLRFGLTHRWMASLIVSRADAFRPEFIHGHFGYPVGLASILAARTLGVPVAVTLHGGDINVLPVLSRWTAARIVRVIRDVDIGIAVSEALADRSFVLAGRRPIVLPLGIELKRFRCLPSKSEARARLGLPQEGRLALFVGHLGPAKGLLELVEAAKRLDRSWHVALVGDGPLFAQASGIPQILTFGLRRPEDIPMFMAASDVFVLPSHSEGMPTVLIEAGAAGLPVVATPVGGIPELLAEGRGVMLPAAPTDPASIADALSRLITGDGTDLALGRRLQSYVLERYDSNSCAQQLLAQYRLFAKQAAPGLCGDRDAD